MSAKKVKPAAPTSPQRIRLDWRAYFHEFCRVHGEPVEHGGRLLFKDGWGYSLSDYSGPEFPPPKDHTELDALVIRYWVIRRKRCTDLFRDLVRKRDALVDLQRTHSLDLQQTVTTLGEGGQTVKESGRLDLGALHQQIEWVSQDVAECDDRLREIEEFHRRAALGPTDREGRAAS